MSDSSNKEALLADFKKRKNMVSGLTVAGRLVMSTNLWEALQLPETTGDMVQGRLGPGSHTARVFMTWSIIIMMTLLFVAGIYLLQKHLENSNNI